jgi:CHAT domain-containing protein
MFGEAAVACVDQRMPRTALHFGGARVDVAFAWSRAVVIADALVARAEIHHTLGGDDQAVLDLRTAREWIPGVADKTWSDRLHAEADAAEGKVLARRQPEAAVRALERSIGYFEGPDPARVPSLRLLLARALAARGLDDAAEAQLLAGIQALENQRTFLEDAALQVSFFDQALPLFEDMVRLQVTQRADPERALAFVERGRARQVVDSLPGGATPFEPEALRQELPPGLTLVYHVPLADRLLAWAVSREGSHFIERPLPAAELSRLVAAHRAAIEGRASEGVVRQTAARLHDELVHPFIPFLASQRALVFIPGGILHSVPFASLWDRQTGRYLVEDHVLGVAPSGTVFMRASAGAGIPTGGSARALIVGNPRLDQGLAGGWPDLPAAEVEAVEIGRLYTRSTVLTGRAATTAAFRAGIRGSHVVHYAGHAASSEHNPSAARLLLAADLRTGDPGEVYLHDLGHWRLPDTRVVVLAACRTAAGPISRVEGPRSLARPFLAAGVRDVVASLWDVDDTNSRRFFVAFHSALLAEGHPFVALRKAQLAMLTSGDVQLAHPASWAAFICMGGLDPHSLSKGDAS